MKRIICILLLIMFRTAALELSVDDFSWRIPWKHGSYKVENQVIELNFSQPAPKGSRWHNGYLKKKVLLGQHRYLTFQARSVDGRKHLIYFYIRRRLSPEDEASFYSLLEVPEEWTVFRLRLQKKAESGGKVFKFIRGSKNCSRSLSDGGQLMEIMPATTEAARVQFRNFVLTNQEPELSDEAASIERQIRSRPLRKPYAFQLILKPHAVPAAGFHIAVSSQAGQTEEFAARELSGYLKKVTGREFPIHRGPVDSHQRKIVLSVSHRQPEEGFSSSLTDGRTLQIVGNSSRALLYAVYDFLEKAAGIRWFAPFGYGEVVPVQPDLHFPLFRDQEEPRMSYRCPHYCSKPQQPGGTAHLWAAADWFVKNRFNVQLERIHDRAKIKDFYASRGGCIWLLEQGGHNFHTLIPPRKYFKDHPDFFCFDRATGKWRATQAQLCTTNPELIRELGRIADRYFQRNPDHQCLPLFQEDGNLLWCQCPACLALNPSGSNLLSATENNINLANLVCAEIQKKYPDKGVFTYAYGRTVRPPVNIRPRPGVRIMYCYSPVNPPHHTPWIMETSRDLMTWSRLTQGNMVLYTYHYLNPRFKYNDDETMVKLFRFFDILGLKGSNQETWESWAGQDGYQLYQGGRLAWNPWIDDKALKKDYFEKLYGAAGSRVEEFVECIRQVLVSAETPLRHGLGNVCDLPDATAERMKKLLAEADDLVAGDKRAQQALQAQKEYFDYLKTWFEGLRAADRYYRDPSEQKYNEATAAYKRIGTVSKKYMASRVVSPWSISIFKIWQNLLDASWRENKITLQVKSKYHVVRELNPWKFKTDPKAQGESGKWYAADFNDSQWPIIRSGKFWEDQGYPAYDGAAWYRCSIDLPENGKQYGLYFTGADERAWVYLDGKYIGGHHQGDVGVLWEEPFTIMLPENAKAGKHQLSVRVIDSSGKGGLWKPVLLIRPKN